MELRATIPGKPTRRPGRPQTFCFLLTITLWLYCPDGIKAQDATTTKLSLQVRQKPLSAVFKEIELKTGLTVEYQHNTINKDKLISIQAVDETVSKILNRLLAGTGTRFIQQGKSILIVLDDKPATPAPAKKKDPGRVTGKIIDEETGQAVAGATVMIGGKTMTTDMEGSFSVSLSKGSYTATISYVGYGTKKVSDIDVKDDQTFSLDVTLKRGKGQLSAVIVQGSAKKESIAALYARQKSNAAVSDGISAEQITRTPDNNAAQVLKRISGLTVQDEKFVTIRGLGDRYNNVLLNGASLPSTEPNRRNFSFDIIPSALIDNIVVNKTATPDMPAEFSGGLVQVSTKDIPADNYTSITVGSGINTNSIGKKMYSTKRGKYDYLGYDDGTRNWWQKKWDRFQYAEHYREGNYEKMGEMNRKIPNNWGLFDYKYSPVQNYQLAAGRKLTLKNESTIGIILAATYRHEEINEDEERRTYTGDSYDFNGNAYQFRSALGGLLNIAYQHKGHKVSFKNTYNHLFGNESTIYYGAINGFGSRDQIARNYSSITILNDIWQHRLEGAHAIGKKGIKINWSGDWIRSYKRQPDTRYSLAFRAPSDPEEYYTYYIAERTGFFGVGSSMFNSDYEESRYNWEVNLALSFKLGAMNQKLKAGYTGTYRDAFFESVGLLMIGDPHSRPFLISEARTLPDYELFAPEYLKPEHLFYYPTGSTSSAAGDDYSGIQRMHSGYLMADLNVFSKLRLVAGLRVEKNYTSVNTRTYNPDTGYPVDSTIVYDKPDVFPSANFIYTHSAKMNTRLAYSQTISRPDFRERSPFRYYDFKQRAPYTGATSVKDARITNIDLRHEYYPGPGEVLSASVFYKKFDSPVELVVGGTPSGEVYYFFNLRNSTAWGAEIDFRKSLSFINPSSSALKDITISGNASWMTAKVRYNTEALLKAANGVTGGNETSLPPDSRSRLLQGLSPYIYNAGIGYTGKPVGININYNRYGPRIITGGLYPYMDQYENSRDVIDLQLSTQLLKNSMNIRLNISDLLQQAFIVYQNMPSNGQMQNSGDISENANNDPKGKKYNPDLDYTRFRGFRGRNISINVTYNF